MHPAVEALSDGALRSRVYARIGLLGNPSDGFRGKVLALSLAQYWAEVTLTPTTGIHFRLNPESDRLQFTSLEAFKEEIDGNGYYGGVRILKAMLRAFIVYCRQHNVALDDSKGFTLSYNTTIPRQRGLSGSSAIACAALNCLIELYGLEKLVPVGDRPALILSAERALGITAGLQDRIIQVYGGLVLMDFSGSHGNESPCCRTIAPSLLPSLYLIYEGAPSGKDSGMVHSNFKERWEQGDPQLRVWMEEVASLAEQGAAMLESGVQEGEETAVAFARLMDRNFDCRRLMFGDAALGESNVRMVEVARSVQAAAKFTGSGGAVAAFCPLGKAQAGRLTEACKLHGLVCEPVVVGPQNYRVGDK